MTAASARTVERVCAYCHGAFWADYYAVRRGKGTYCSRSCASRGTAVTRGVTVYSQGVTSVLSESPGGLPTLRWSNDPNDPDERDKIPFKCPRPHCGGMIETDPPYGLVKLGEARCLLCTRTVALLKAGAVREIQGPFETVVEPPARKDRHDHLSPRPAPLCGHTITRRSSSGYCPPCLQSRACERCGGVAGRRGRKGLCAACYERDYKPLRQAARREAGS